MSFSERKEIPHELVINDVNINLNEHRIAVRGKEVKLTRVEWLLLNELAINAGHLMVYYDLLARVWGPEYRDDVQILRTWISRLRQKIELEPANPRIISTVPKTGYIFNTR